MSELDSLLDLMRRNRQKSAWGKNRTFHEMVDELEKEVHELRAEKDPEKIREELGDVLLDAIFLVAIAEDEGWFTSKEFVEKAEAKFVKRKPWIFTDEDVPEEEEVRRWHAAKAKEK